jgi:hypothetical protein
MRAVLEETSLSKEEILKQLNLNTKRECFSCKHTHYNQRGRPKIFLSWGELSNTGHICMLHNKIVTDMDSCENFEDY